jgi:starch phosphorylase
MDIGQFRATLGQHPLAYMSAEFGLDDRLPIYSGGLGVLAGDIIREAAQLNLPFVGVGLLYHEGYFQQVITPEGKQRADYPLLNTDDAPIRLVVDTTNEPIAVSIPMAGGELHIQVWEYLESDVSVYLLDTDLPRNNNEYRFITRQLYGGNLQNRILQEIVLGIGGVRMLMKLGIHPSLFHLNESHSAFAIMEIAHHYMEEYGMSFAEAYDYGRNKIVFTNHTLVAAGNEVFPKEMVRQYLGAYTEQLHLPMDELLAKGTSPDSPEKFAMSTMALSMASRVNTVSKLHEQEARSVWPGVAMPAITNGVNLPYWVSADFKAQAPNFALSELQGLAPDQIWTIHEMAKHRLVDEVKYRTGHQLKTEAMIITWARRFATYKRPKTLFEDIEELKRLVTHSKQPIQVLMAGKAHPEDTEGQGLIEQIHQEILRTGLTDKIVFVPNYSLGLAKFLVSGSDLWLNTPIRGREASGTSGMKASANGVLQLSVSDGWVDEVTIPAIGWEISDANCSADVYRLLRELIIPLYYKRNAQGFPEEWVKLMRTNMQLIWTQFSSRRMLEQYIDVLYRPALEMESKDKHEHNWRRNYRTR